MIAPSPQALLTLDAIADHQRLRTKRIASVLGNDLGSSARDYAIAHHCLEGAEHAARAKDAELLTWYREKTPHDLTHLTTDPHIVLNPHPTNLLRGEISDTTYYLISPDTSPAPPEAQGLVQAAVTSATEHGFGPLLTHHAAVICLLNHRQLADPLRSWALTRLPGTVFTDYTSHPEILARDLIHEAAHNWLNDALAAYDVTFPDDVTFFSPWRDRPRPVFGFLHACWAFSLTVLYVRRALPETTGAAHPFLDTYLRQQRERFTSAAGAVPRALAFATADAIRERVGRAVHEVVEPT
ncbi:aKG-HExxH-type peptide beta-hydroxylase [Streptomyces sp. MUSC 125]|uniref:aKG-HExxH-type peptide beta-hydroxylase n=1 Tax=Streptomyces sp. MUSC 125 TaxID=1428624 RepID=UPI000691AF0B|nr:HEXXH motif-containing putative peptide modification protein [Streptomyces sp. MUSC 125]